MLQAICISTLCSASSGNNFAPASRVYKLNSSGATSTGRGTTPAEAGTTLGSVSTGKVDTITLKKNMTVKEAEDAFANIHGLGVQSEDKEGKFANDQLRISDLRKYMIWGKTWPI